MRTEPHAPGYALSVTVRDLQPGDVLQWSLYAPYRVVSNVRSSWLWGLISRYSLTLTDANAKCRTFILTGDRGFQKLADYTGPIGVWFDDAVAVFTRMAKEDSVVSHLLTPISRPSHMLFRSFLDLQCLLVSIRLRAGFLGILVVLIVFAVTLASQFPVEYSVAISILGSFVVERCWAFWSARVRRRLSKGLSMTVRYRQHGLNPRYKYGKLRITKTTAFIVGVGPSGMHPWSSAQLELIGRKNIKRWLVPADGRLPLTKWVADIKVPHILATCTIANDIRGDQTYTCHKVADAIRHRITDGSRRQISYTSTRYDPDNDKVPDLSISPGRNHSVFGMTVRDRDEKGWYSVQLKRYQMRVLADTLEVMDDGRRL